MRYRRVVIPGATYFITANLLDRKSKLLIEHIAQLRSAFKKTMHYYPFNIDSIVIPPDHFHLVMNLPENDGNYSLRMNMMKGFFSKQIPTVENVFEVRKRKRREGSGRNDFGNILSVMKRIMSIM